MSTRYGLIALTALTLIAGPALARPNADEAPRQAKVSYADLNLNTAAGQAVLAARIRRAAEAVCGPEPDSRDVKALMTFNRCMKQSTGEALAAIPAASQTAGSAKPAG
jgi:UrcA family protein